MPALQAMARIVKIREALDDLSYEDLISKIFSKIEQTKVSLQKLSKTCNTKSQELTRLFGSLDTYIQKFKDHENARFSCNAENTENKAVTKFNKMFADNTESESLFRDVSNCLIEIAMYQKTFCDNSGHEMFETMAMVRDIRYALYTKYSYMLLRLAQEADQERFKLSKQKLDQIQAELLAKVSTTWSRTCEPYRRHRLFGHTKRRCYCRTNGGQLETSPLSYCEE